MPISRKTLLLTLALLGLSSGLLADDDDGAAPIRIISEEAFIDENQNIVRYRGDVVVTQGQDLTARANEVLVKLSAERELQTMEFFGAPATVISTAVDLSYKASGLKINYDLQQRKLFIEDEAILIQDGQSLSSAKITYDLDSSVVHASSDSNSSAANPRRVEVIYQPPGDN